MVVSKGDVFVFKGNYNNSRHFENFVVGQKYVVLQLSDMSGFYEDSPYGEDLIAVVFENSTHGVYKDQIHNYFYRYDEFRDNRLESLGI